MILCPIRPCFVIYINWYLVLTCEYHNTCAVIIFDQHVHSLILKSVQEKCSVVISASLSELCFIWTFFQRKILLFTYGRLMLNCKTKTRKRFIKLLGKQPIGTVPPEPSSTKFINYVDIWTGLSWKLLFLYFNCFYIGTSQVVSLPILWSVKCSLNFDRFLLSTYQGSGSSVVLDQLINSCEVNLLNNEGWIQQTRVGVTSVFNKHPRLRLNSLNT